MQISKSKELPHLDDGAVIDATLSPQGRRKLGLGRLFGLRRNGPEQPELVLPQELDGPLRQGTAFLDPAIPAYLRGHVIGLEACRSEHTERSGSTIVPIPSPGIITTV